MPLQITVPSVGESVREGVIQRWLKNDSEQVAVDDVLVELETDKATVEIVAEAAGVLTIKKEAGSTVTIGEVIAVIDETTASTTVSSPAEKTKVAEKQPEPAPKLSPAVRRIVAEEKIDATKIEGSGKDGRLLKADVASPPTEKKHQTSGPEPAASTSRERERRVPMSMIRRRIAERLVTAKNETAMLTTFNEINMEKIISCRNQYKDTFKQKYDVSLGFMGFFCLACTTALQEFPELNAFVADHDVIYHDYVNMGIAVSTERGLVVPVIKNIAALSLAEIEIQISQFAAKARENKISVDDMSHGTFTISNGGVFGSLLSTPILNPPQSGILGMHKIAQRPIVCAEKIVPAAMMYVALSYDHRIADGKQAVGFLVRVKELVEDPTRLLLRI